MRGNDGKRTHHHRRGQRRSRRSIRPQFGRTRENTAVTINSLPAVPGEQPPFLEVPRVYLASSADERGRQGDRRASHRLQSP